VISLRNLSFGYGNEQLLRSVNLEIAPGQLVLICGPTGSGKSTLLKLLNGLAPNFTGGTLDGEIFVSGVSVNNSKPNELANLIGFVNQQPESAFVADTVSDEIRFGMEQLGFSREQMSARLNEIAKLTSLEHLLDRSLSELSGGQQQAVAIAAALAAGQKILLLDEPTSALDKVATEKILDLLRKLIDETGITVVLAEHRIERVLERVDSVVLVGLDGTLETGNPEQVFRDYRLVPPVVQLGQKLNWHPLVLSVEAARNKVADAAIKPTFQPRTQPQSGQETLLEANQLRVDYRDKIVVDIETISLHEGEITALMGENGAGKSSLLLKLWQDNQSVATLVPQRAADLLFLPTVRLEFEESDRHAAQAPGSTAALFTKLSQRVDPAAHPRDLSTGQQLALVLAIQLVKKSRVVLLDEPTGGLDYQAKAELADWILDLRREGKAVLVASHDTEFIASCADRVLQIHEGKIIGEGTPEEFFDYKSTQPTQIAEIVQVSGLVSLKQVANA